MDKPLQDRAGKLTPREWRVVALLLEGVGTQAACEALGVAPGTLESHKQAIRRKLAVPRGVRLEGFLREHVAHLPVPVEPRAASEPSDPARAKEIEDRRLRWLLRLTLQELSEVAASAGLRAELLEQTVQRMGSSDPGEARREIEDLQHVARELGEIYRRLLDHARRP